MEKKPELNNNIVLNKSTMTYYDPEFDVLDELVNFYCSATEIRHLGILCRKASYNMENVQSYINDLRSKYNI